MNVSFASLITTQIEKSHPNVPFSMRKFIFYKKFFNSLNRIQTTWSFLARINPLSLQELCRFKIRRTIRESIEAESPDYYAIKREKTNFNTTKKLGNIKEATYSSYLNDSQEEIESDQEETDRPNYPITRFERIFSPNSNVDFNSNFEHQIRLMIYGHILDAANNSLELAVNAANDLRNSESDSDNEQDSNNEIVNNNNGSDQGSSSGSFKSLLDDLNLSTPNYDAVGEESDAASEADLFELFAENCRKARSSGNLLWFLVIGKLFRK